MLFQRERERERNATPCILENGGKLLTSLLREGGFQNPYVYRINAFKQQAIITFTYLFRGLFWRALFRYDDLEQTLVYDCVLGWMIYLTPENSLHQHDVRRVANER